MCYSQQTSSTVLPEEFHEIVKLSVNISANGDWTLDLLNVRLLRQDLFGLK